MRKFFYLSTCYTCKLITKKLNLNNSIIKIDIKKNPLNQEQLEEIYKIVGSYEMLFNKRAQLYKKRNLKELKLQEGDYKKLLLEHYTFLKRPILIYDNNCFVGNANETVLEANVFLNEQ